MNSHNHDEQDAINGLKTQIAPCIWDTDEFSGKVTKKIKFIFSHSLQRAMTIKHCIQY